MIDTEHKHLVLTKLLHRYLE